LGSPTSVREFFPPTALGFASSYPYAPPGLFYTHSTWAEDIQRRAPGLVGALTSPRLQQNGPRHWETPCFLGCTPCGRVLCSVFEYWYIILHIPLLAESANTTYTVHIVDPEWGGHRAQEPDSQSPGRAPGSSMEADAWNLNVGTRTHSNFARLGGCLEAPCPTATATTHTTSRNEDGPISVLI